jgi:hypothetical protein
VLRRLVPSAYRPVLASRVFRRLILGFVVSYLGDGMSFVAVAWLAIELAPTSALVLGVDALTYVDGRHRGRLGARAVAVRVRRADGRYCCVLTLGGAIYGPFVPLSLTLM